MSTNFYLKAKPHCAHCGRGPDEGLHIGKSSYGWVFSLHVRRPSDSDSELPADLEGWKALFEKHGVIDEYGDDVTVSEMLGTITERRHKGLDGNLRRNTVDDSHCIGHGPGTYDYIVGEFS